MEGTTTEHGLGANVHSLTEDLHNTHWHVYFDKYFSGVDLLLGLLRNGLYGCGTLRSNGEGFPQLKEAVKKGFKERGQSKTCQNNNVTVSVWQDNRPVSVIATNSDRTKPRSVTQKHKDGTSHTYPCPPAVAEYNLHMGGVDNSDQLRGYYHVRLKCYKYMFDLIVTNCFIATLLTCLSRPSRNL